MHVPKMNQNFFNHQWPSCILLSCIIAVGINVIYSVLGFDVNVYFVTFSFALLSIVGNTCSFCKFAATILNDYWHIRSSESGCDLRLNCQLF